MITIEKVGDAIRFTFVGNDHYLNEGTIEVPINSLSLVIDDSGMATFKKASSNDVFVSATYQELGMTKAELEEFYKENMVGKVGSEITPEEVEEMIDEAVSGKLDTSAITTEITSASTDSQVPSAKLMYDVIDEIEDVTATALNSLNERLDDKQDQLIAGSGITISGNVISADGGITSGEVQDMIDESISGKADSSAVTESIEAATSGKQDQLIAGSGIQLSGNNISAVYEAVTVMHEEFEMYNRMEPFYVKKADDCPNQTTGDFRVMTDGNFFMFTFDYANGSYFGHDFGWEEYLTIEWNSEYQMFFVMPLQTLESAGDSGCVRVVEPYDILVESETTNASIKQLKSDMSERITYTDANNIFLTQNAAEITYLKKEDALVDTVDYTLQDFYNNSYCGFEGKVVKIQDGYDKFAIRTAGTYNWSPYYINNVGKGLLKESFTIALSQIIEDAVKNGASRYWDDLTTEEFLDDGLVGRYLFYIEAPYNDAFVYFKIESYTINSTNSGATFEFAGKMYHDTEFTMPYRNEFSCDWYLQGSYVIDGTDVIIQSSTFNAEQLEGDGFFGSDINNGAASIYDSNGIMHKVSSTSIRAHAPSGYFTYFLYALINDFNSVQGDSFAYLPTEDCITYDYIQEGVLVNSFKLGTPIKMIDYSKLKPFNFKYNIDTSSTDSHLQVGYEYSFGNIPSTYSTDINLNLVCNLNGNSTTYTLGHYNATTKEITYYDEGVEGIYTIEVLNNGHRIVKLEDAAIAKHFTITNLIGNAAIYSRYYVHYQPYSFVDKVNDLEDELNGKQDQLIAGSGITISGNVISADGGGSITIDPTLDSGSTNAVANSAITNAINSKQEKGIYLEEVVYDQTNKEALFYSGPYVQGRLSMYDKNNTDNLLANKVDTSAITSSVTSASTDSEVPTAKAVHDAISAGGGGGKAIEAGRGISVTTGATADTVSFNLPISAGTGTNSIIIGSGTASQTGALVHGANSSGRGVYSTVFAFNSDANGNYSFTAGGYLKNYVECGAAFGKYNDTTNSPLFSVGNGTADNARHNAFEVRQNGDIYITSGATDIKLQDHLGGGGGGGSTYSAGTNISIDSANTISCTLPITATSNNSLIFLANNTNSNITNSIVGGNDNDVKNTQYSFVFGQSNTLSGVTSRANIIGYSNKSFNSDTFVGGTYNKALNHYETDFGVYNNSVSASTTFGDSGNTLFSVGNGTSNGARRNAFEIRQNGDIYINSGATDVNLQTVLDDFNTRLTNLETNIANILAQI